MRGNKHLFIFSLFIYFLLTKNVFAACDYESQVKLQQEAANIKLSYEESGSYLNLIFENVPNTLYLSTEAEGKAVIKIYGNGSKQTYLWTKTDEPINMRFDVYASSLSQCPDNLVSTLFLNLPTYNKFSTREECNNSNLYVCNTFTSSIITQSDFDNAFNETSKIDVDDEEEVVSKEKQENKVITFIKDNKLYIISFGSLIVFGVVTGIILNKRKNSIF